MSDDRFDVVVHHGGDVKAHEEAAEVEIGDSSGLNSDVEVEGEIEVEGEKLFEVRHISMVGDKYTVNVDAQHCSCRKWLLTIIPYCHAIAVMNFINVNVEDFIQICFKRSIYEEIY